MKSIIGLVLAVGIASNACGQELPKPAPHALELARRVVFAATDEETMIAQARQLSRSMMQKSLDQMLKTSGLQMDVDKFIETIMPFDEIDKATRGLLARQIEIYATVYSEDDLQGIVNFYASPAGKSFLAKTPLVQKQLEQSMLSSMTEMGTAAQARMRQALTRAKQDAESAKALPAT
jgi:hypothetical protein